MGDPAGVYAAAVSPVSAQLRAAGVAARAALVVSVAQPPPGPVTVTCWLPPSAIRRPSGAAARASGTSARPVAGGRVAQPRPPSRVVVMAEKVRYRLGRSPTTMPW